MRNIYSLILILLSTGAFGQNYLPFDANSPKRFQEVNNPAIDTNYFYALSSSQVGDSIVIEQFFRTSTTQITVPQSQCYSWGSGQSYVGDTTWLGREIIYNSILKTLDMKNAAGEVLLFDFSLASGDSALFYQTATDDYYIKHTQQQQESILGFSDMVKTFEVLHYDNVGVPVSSPLHQFEIKLGDTLGMIQFIDCNHFPNVEMGLELRGQLRPNVGYYQMTYDQAYPWQIGDELEYRGNAHLGLGGGSITTYRLLQVTNRVETSDSVKIYFNITNQEIKNPPSLPYGGFVIDLGNPLVYAKGDVIYEVPPGIIADTIYMNDSVNDCGLRNSLTMYNDFYYYCDSCQCRLPFDGGWGAWDETWGYKEEFGYSYYYGYLYGDIYTSSSSTLIYSDINGVQCGQYVAFGIEENENQRIEIFPNPATESIQFNLSFHPDRIAVYDLSGSLMLEDWQSNSNVILDVKHLASGLYILHVEGEKGVVQNRFIVQR
jgi:hypothetical protein